MPALAFGQQGSSRRKRRSQQKPTRKRSLKSSPSDKAKLQTYSESKKLYDQMGAAYKKNDSKTADALSKQADALASKLGPEYSKVMDGLEQVDPNASEGKEFMAILSGLDKLCTGPALAQTDQPAADQPAPHQPAPVQSRLRPKHTLTQPRRLKPAPTKPCIQIRAACIQAGFVPGGANMGVGIIVDCIRPSWQVLHNGSEPPSRCHKSTPQVVLACKNQNPNFGGGVNAQPSGQPTPSSTMEAPNQ